MSNIAFRRAAVRPIDDALDLGETGSTHLNGNYALSELIAMTERLEHDLPPLPSKTADVQPGSKKRKRTEGKKEAGKASNERSKQRKADQAFSTAQQVDISLATDINHDRPAYEGFKLDKDCRRRPDMLVNLDRLSTVAGLEEAGYTQIMRSTECARPCSARLTLAAGSPTSSSTRTTPSAPMHVSPPQQKVNGQTDDGDSFLNEVLTPLEHSISRSTAKLLGVSSTSGSPAISDCSTGDSTVFGSGINCGQGTPVRLSAKRR